MGFKASEAVERLDYDFEEYGPKGTIPEPTTRQVDDFRATVFGTVKTLASDLGVDLTNGVADGKVNFDILDTVMERSSEVEKVIVDAVADLTGLPNHTLNALPYRLKAAFCGWITGKFLNPEA